MDLCKGSLVNRFLEYVKIDTTSDSSIVFDKNKKVPSTEGQFELARLLKTHLIKIGCTDVVIDNHCYVYATIPPNIIALNEQIDKNKLKEKTVAFFAHIDTSDETSGKNVKPKIIENYDGCSNLGHIPFCKFPEILKKLKDKTVIITDGTTLLGADDKAGIAAIIEAAERFIRRTKESPHSKNYIRCKYPIKLCFTPDEEISHMCKNIDLDILNAGYGYVVDGNLLGDLEYECFYATKINIKISGINIHSGHVKNKMVNACSIATEIHQMLPKELPENTEGYEGFYHLCKLNGNVSSAVMEYKIRDFEEKQHERRIEVLKQAVNFIKFKYTLDDEDFKISIEKEYNNMKKYLTESKKFVLEFAKMAIESVGLKYNIIPIRGGVDSAGLGELGIPTVNIFIGSGNLHSVYEFCCVEWLEKTCNTIEKLMEYSQDIDNLKF